MTDDEKRQITVLRRDGLGYGKIAQQESQSLNQNVKLGLQYRYQRGEVQINCNHFLGYAKDENKRMVVVPEEAEIVKRIYREYLEGASMLKIARNLTADGLKNGAGHTKWRDSNIRQILQNEKYMGDSSCRKPIRWIFLPKSASRILASCHSIM